MLDNSDEDVALCDTGVGAECGVGLLVGAGVGAGIGIGIDVVAERGT